ncbi:MAG: SNF7 family protein [Candidatus Thorarchaeota archaeon]|nr:SNF7 family protein [Candidatus Thorarchaeota archaeon]
MGFLSGKKKVNTEQSILELKGVINSLSLSIRQYDSQIDEHRRAAKAAIRQNDRALAKTHLQVAADLQMRRAKLHRQVMTLQAAITNITDATTQSEVFRAIRVARQALKEQAAMLRPEAIQTEMDGLADAMDQVSIAGEILSEDLTGASSSLEVEEAADRELASLEAEMLMETEGVLPPVDASLTADTVPATTKSTTETSSSSAEAGSGSDTDAQIDQILAELEQEARAERKKEAEK